MDGTRPVPTPDTNPAARRGGVFSEKLPGAARRYPPAGNDRFATAGGGAGRVWGDQSGRTSAPIIPHLVQTIRGHNDRTGVSSGSQSAFMVAL